MFPMVSLFLLAALALGEERSVYRVAFGSCLNQLKTSKALRAAAASSADVFVFLGDNTYHDMPHCGIPWNHEKCDARQWLRFFRRVGTYVFRRLCYGAAIEDSLRRKDDYEILGKNHIVPFLQKSPGTQVLATYDDHDFGRDDSGEDYEYKHDSRAQFSKFWGALTQRNYEKHTTGIYDFFEVERLNLKIQFVVLDTRFARTAWREAKYTDRFLNLLHLYFSKNATCPTETQRNFISDEPQMLSEEQWLWLESILQRPAHIRIIASSIQVFRPYDGAESWSLMPKERQKLLRLVSSASGQSLFISGDVHYGELAHFSRGLGSEGSQNFFELTSSGLTETWPCSHANPHRIQGPFHNPNFGIIDIFSEDTIRLQLRDENNNIVINHTIHNKGLDFCRNEEDPSSSSSSRSGGNNVCS